MLRITTDTSLLAYNWYYILGMYDQPSNTIILNINSIKRSRPESWRRLAVVTFAHEFIHYLQALFGHDFDTDNPYTRYVAEYQAAVVDRFVARLMRYGQPRDPETEALSSIHSLTKYYMEATKNVVEEKHEELTECPRLK